jgi:hypothetical protein
MGARSSPTTSRYGGLGTGRVAYQQIDGDSIPVVPCCLCNKMLKVGSVAVRIYPLGMTVADMICKECLMVMVEYCPEDYTDERFKDVQSNSKLVDWVAVG